MRDLQYMLEQVIADRNGFKYFSCNESLTLHIKVYDNDKKR